MTSRPGPQGALNEIQIRVVPSVPNYLQIDLLPQQQVPRLRRQKDSLHIKISSFSNTPASKPGAAADIKDGRGALECQADKWRGKFGGVGKARSWKCATHSRSG